MKKKKFLQSEEAQSVVIGVVLLIGIAVTASTIYFASQIPEWTKEFESIHSDKVSDDFAELSSVIDEIRLKQEQGAVGTTPIKMSPDKVPIIGFSPPGSTLLFEPQAAKFEISVNFTANASATNMSETGVWEQNVTTFSAFEKRFVVIYSDGLTLAPLRFKNLTLDGSVARLEGEHYYDRVELKNGSILYVGGNLKIIANRILVDSSSRIIADGRGFLGGGSGKSGCGLGSGIKGSTGSGGGGAGYGADGGAGGNNNCSGGSSYGNETSLSLSMGSGGGGGGAGSGDFGGASGGAGGNGGGEIWLEANSVNIAGTVSANGDHGLSGSDCLGEQAGGGGGGGSGGGILIRGREVEVSEAKLTAKGGDGGTGGSVVTGGTAGSGGGGGAGGRIKIFYENGSGIEPYSWNVEGGKPGSSSSEKNGTKGGEGTLYEEEIDYYESFITHYPSGYFVSEVHDTGSNSTCYGKIRWNATVAEGQRLIMKVRTSISREMEGNATPWEKCVAVSNGECLSTLPSVLNTLRFVQYRAELETDDPATTPVLHWVKIDYNSSCSPSPVPFVSIRTDKRTYTTGERMKVEIRVANPSNTSRSVVFRWWLTVPSFDFTTVPVATVPMTLPPGYGETFSFPINVGYWGEQSFGAVWGVTLSDPETEETVSFDATYWNYKPTAEAETELAEPAGVKKSPEKTAKAIAKEVEGVVFGA